MKMAIRIKSLFTRIPVEPVKDCCEIADRLAEQHKEVRARIDDMIAATMNGEEDWFLTIQKEKKNGNVSV